MEAKEILTLILLCVMAFAMFVLVGFALVKFFRKLSKADTIAEAKEATLDFIDDIKSIASDDKFENVRNFSVNLIFNIIENGDNFNIREVLGSVREKCSKENVEYNEEEWADFVTTLYEKKKGAK